MKQFLKEGVLGLGCVRQINELYIELETVDGVTVTLPATNISEKSVDLLKNSSLMLCDIITIGQILSFKVVKEATPIERKHMKKKFRNPVVSVDPCIVNSHIVPSQLFDGLVMNASVESTEDKGVIMNLGLRSSHMNGFLPISMIPSAIDIESFLPGQVLLVRIEKDSRKSSEKRVIQLSAMPEAEILNSSIDKLQFNHLMPGMMLYASPLKIVSDGAFVEIGNGLKAFIGARHLPPNLKYDLSKFSKELRVVVTLCQQNSNILMLNAHPDIIAVSNARRRISFANFEIGDELSCKVRRIDRSGNVHFEIVMDENPRSHAISAFCPKKKLEPVSYAVGSIHNTRVLSYRIFERVLIVATKKEILAQKMVSVKDAVPGQKVQATISEIKPVGLFVKIYGNISGFIPACQTSDRMSHRISKNFFVGQKIDCRILKVNLLKKRIILTRKPSLLNSKDRIINKYSLDDIGLITTGYISSILSSGGILVNFYGDVRALMLSKEAARLSSSVKIGSTLQVRIQSVEPERCRMLVTLADPFLSSKNSIVKFRPFSSLEESSLTYPAVIKGSARFKLGLQKRERLDIVINLGRKEGRYLETSLPSDLLSDNLDPPFDELDGCLRTNSKIRKVTILGELNGLVKVTAKRFVVEYLERHGNIKNFEELIKGQLICGIVTQYHSDLGYLVEVVGGAALSAPAHFLRGNDDNAVNELFIGQTVVGMVSSINSEKKRFSLIMDASMCFPADETDVTYFGVALLQSAISELQWFAANNGKGVQLPNLGSRMEAFVAATSEDGLIVNVLGYEGITGVVKNSNFPSGDYVENQRLAVVVLWTIFPSCQLFLYALNKTDQLESNISAKSKSGLEIGEKVLSKVVLTTRDFVATVTDSGNVVYLPNRFHPNIVPQKSRFSLFESISVIIKSRVDNCYVGLGEYDVHEQTNKQQCAMNQKIKKKMKPFLIYPAKVLSLWKRGCNLSPNSIELELPDGNIGRLHASEIDESLLDEGCRPADEFLRLHKGKIINIKVIGISKIKEVQRKGKGKLYSSISPAGQGKVVKVLRIAECTVLASKLRECKKKQSVLGYPHSYVHGSTIAVFVKYRQKDGVLRVEASPIWDGVIRKQNLGEENLIVNPVEATSSTLIDIEFQPGQVLKAKIIGVNASQKRHHKKCLELSLTESEKIAAGERVLGRIINLNKTQMSVMYELTNAQRAMLTATGMCNEYKQAFKRLQSLQLNEVNYIYLLRFDDQTGVWLAVTEDRFKSSKCAKLFSRSKLIKSPEELSENSIIYAFVSMIKNGKVYAEVGPGIIGLVRGKKSNGDFEVHELIKVRAGKSRKNGTLNLLFLKSLKTTEISNGETKNVKRLGRKRAASLSSLNEAEKKSRAAGYVISLFVIKFSYIFLNSQEMVDPGFDWSLKGYTPADFVAVARIGTEDLAENEALNKKASNLFSASGKIEGEQLVKEKGDFSKLPKTKEEFEMAKEKALTNREKRLIKGDFLPDSASDFDRLVIGNPNCSELWIRYMSFFMEKNDITKARAVAEKALQLINFREEDEIFNVWTAYLNLENSYGNIETLKAVFDRAIKNTDALKMYKQMAKIYQSVNNVEEADILFEEMLKRFRHEDLDIWHLYMQHLMETKRASKARDLLKKGIISIPKKHHLILLCRFAQLEYKVGDAEQGKTIFESILSAYPKKTEIWTVYIDMVVKVGLIDEARNLFTRVTSMNLPFHKIKLFYKKWSDIEERFGDEGQQNSVKRLASHYVENIATKMNL
ncbi:unnamed protein product [Dracunculus medinensis]|uniref:S1 motif domain-containing protein n=1 Tax=Dracunculus medinensis TaxID=318479 RepID=A0A0N4U7R6_DRAME|nr:unnamed protein product [Dracunculus medinensis]